MKRKSLYTISTLLALLGGTTAGAIPSAYAETEIYGTRYYQVPELLALNGEVEAMMGTDCAADALCADDFRWSLYGIDGKYRALEKLMSSPFVVTAVNPDEGTIKVLYNDKAPDFYINSSRNPRQRLPHEFYAFWTEFGTENDPAESLENIIFHAKLNRNENRAVAGTHPLIDWNEEQMGYFPAREETLFIIGDSEFKNNMMGRIYYSIDSTLIGANFYSECINHADYRKGAECQVVYGENMQESYIPVGGIKDEPTLEDPETSETSETSETPAENITTEEPEASEESEISDAPNLVDDDTPTTVDNDVPILVNSDTPTSTEDNNELSVNQTNNDRLTKNINTIKTAPVPPREIEKPTEMGSEDEIEVPFAGDTVSCEKEKKEFPWWLVMLLVLGDVLLVWWFAPTSNGNRKNR